MTSRTAAYCLWEGLKDSNNLELRINWYVSWVEESDIEPHHEMLQDFNKKLIKNKDYRKTVVDEDLTRYLRLIVAIEEGDEIYGTKYEREDFIESNYLEDNNVWKTGQELNKAYKFGMDEATLMLSRKLLENMVISLYRNHGHKLAYFNDHTNQNKGLSQLKKQLDDDKASLKSEHDAVDKKFLKNIEEIRKTCNNHIHQSDSNHNISDDIDEVRDSLQHVVNVLEELDKRYDESGRNIPHSTE